MIGNLYKIINYIQKFWSYTTTKNHIGPARLLKKPGCIVCRNRVL